MIFILLPRKKVFLGKYITYQSKEVNTLRGTVGEVKV